MLLGLLPICAPWLTSITQQSAVYQGSHPPAEFNPSVNWEHWLAYACPTQGP